MNGKRQLGVALSGGGYRASAWGLGVLLYLGDAGLNREVSTISSVSGGSITNSVAGLGDYKHSTPVETWQMASVLAPRLSGSVRGFWISLLLNAASWIVMIVGGAKHSWPLFTLGAGAAVLLSFLAAPLSRDAVFGHPITWLYLVVVFATVSSLALLIGDGWWWLVGLVGLGLVALIRGAVVGWAMERTLMRRKGGRTRLRDLEGGLDHVLCSCDLHGRHHVYFGSDFAYSFGFGLGSRPGLALSAAVQASANLPGAFAPRPMRSAPFSFSEGKYRAPVLALTDGGVYDNMAEEWLISFRARAKAFTARAARLDQPDLKAAVTAVAKRLTDRQPSEIVVANASGPLGFKNAWTSLLPIVGEITSLLRVKSILYDNGNTTRRRLLVDEFIDGGLDGIIVHISTNPWSVVRDGRRSNDEQVKLRAEAAAALLSQTQGLRKEETLEPVTAGTVLYPLASGRVGQLCQRAYAIALVQGHIWRNWPLTAIPSLDDFRGLEEGRVPA